MLSRSTSNPKSSKLRDPSSSYSHLFVGVAAVSRRYGEDFVEYEDDVVGKVVVVVVVVVDDDDDDDDKPPDGNGE